RKNYKKAVDAETKEELTQLAFQEARKLETTAIMHTEGAVGAKILHFGDGRAEFQYSITTNPEALELKELEEIQIQAKTLKITHESDVEKEIKNLLRLFASWDDITDRAVQEGDFVRIDGYDLSREGEPKIFNESRLDVSKDGLNTTWLYEALLGMELGASKVVDTFPNADESDEIKKNFEKKQVRLELKKIEEPKCPELNDEFAQKLGLPTVSDLRQKMRERIEHETLSNHLQGLKDSLIEEILKKISFEVPTLLVDREVASRMRRYLSGTQGKKEYEALSKADQEKKRDEIRLKSEEAIRLYFVIQAIIRKFHIQPPAHMQQALTEIAQKHMKEGSTKRASEQMVQQAQNEQNQYLAEVMMDTALIHVLDKVLHLLPETAHTNH
ncbi:MAG: hypothetical protein ACOYK9_06450, partial [Chlamydiia bacterium]